MGRSIEAFKLRAEITVDNKHANAALKETSEKVEKFGGAFKGILGSFSGEAKEGIEKLEGLAGSFGKLGSAAGLAGGPLGIAAGAIGTVTAAAGGAFFALFKLADE